MWKFPKRIKSAVELHNPELRSSELLYWSEWSNFSMTSYLNLIDYDGKQQSMMSIPWYYIPFTPNDMLQFCEANVLDTYMSRILNQLSESGLDMIPNLIKKILHVSETYGIAYDGEEASNLYRNIMNCLYDKGCEDPNLLVNIWQVLCSRSDLTKETVFRFLDSRYDKPKKAKILLYILRNAQVAHFNFWGAWLKGQESDNYPLCPVTSALIAGNVELMTIFLRYGFQLNSKRVRTYDKYFPSSNNNVYTWLKKPLKNGSSVRRSILTEVMLFLIQMTHYETDRRLPTVIKCFHLLWDSMPIPFVTKLELQDEVRRRFRRPPRGNPMSGFPYTMSQFMSLCELYNWILPDGATEVLEPRALMHLCKCVIRKSLAEAWNLPGGIEALPLPFLMKSYLNV